MGDSPATFLECSPNFPSPSYLIFNIHLYHVYHIHVYHPYFIYIKSHNGCCISSRIFENIPRNGPEFSHRILAIARFLVTAVRKNMGDLLSWLVSVSSSVPELTRHGLERASMSIPRGGGEGCCDAAKAWYCPLVVLWQTQCARHVCLKFDMSNSFNVWGQLSQKEIYSCHAKVLFDTILFVYSLHSVLAKIILRLCITQVGVICI